MAHSSSAVSPCLRFHCRRAAAVTLAGVVLACGSAAILSQPPVGSPTAEAAAKARAESQAHTKGLITLVLDEKKAPEDRRGAVKALAAIGTPEAVRFLVDHASLEVPPIPGGIMQRAQDRPCSYELGAVPGQNWEVGRAVIDALAIKKSSPELLELAALLGHHLGRNLALAAIEDSLARRPPALHREQLLDVHRQLRGPNAP